MTRNVHRRLYLIAAVVIAIATSAYGSWRLLHGVVLGDQLIRLYPVAMLILVVAWIVTDPKIPFRQRPSFDHAMLVWISFPILAGYYMFLAHRWRGFLLMLGFCALIVLPAVAFTLVDVFG